MGNIVLENYQNKAVFDLINLVDNKILRPDDSNAVYLKAVTGAGKTVIMGEYLAKAMKSHPEYRFIWLSPAVIHSIRVSPWFSQYILILVRESHGLIFLHPAVLSSQHNTDN